MVPTVEGLRRRGAGHSSSTVGVPVSRDTISHTSSEKGLTYPRAVGLAAIVITLSACQTVTTATGTSTPEATPNNNPTIVAPTPAATIENPAQIEATATPKIEISMPSPIEGLYYGSYGVDAGNQQVITGAISPADFEASNPDSTYSVPAYGNGEVQVNTLYSETNSETPAATMFDQKWLDGFFNAQTDKTGTTTGTLPDGSKITKQGLFWVDGQGNVLNPIVRNVAGENFGWPMLVVKDNQLFSAVVDGDGKLVGDEQFHPAFQKPSAIAETVGFDKAQDVAHITLTNSGILQMSDDQGMWIGEVRFIGNGETITEWVAAHPPSQDLINQGMQTGVIRQSEEVGRLKFDIHPSLNDKGEVIVFGRDPDTNEILLATRVNPTTHETEWHVAGLRDMADVVGMRMGTQLYSPDSELYPHADIQKINALVVQEYNHAIVMEVGVPFTEYAEGKFNFSNADAAVNLALANGMTVEGDDLIYSPSDFDYSYMGALEQQLRAEGQTDAQIKARFQQIVINHIQTVVDHFKGRISEYSALNEWRGAWAGLPDRLSVIFGNDPEFVRLVFKTAYDADPSARLFINDGDLNMTRSYQYPYTLDSVRDLEAQNPEWLDAVGIQMSDISVAHPPTKQEAINAIRGFGIPVIISSSTFSIEGVTGTPEEIQEKQAQVARDMIAACVESGVCRDFRFWDGYGDKYSFLGVDAHASIFDENMKPKLAYFAIRDYLTQMVDNNIHP